MQLLATIAILAAATLGDDCGTMTSEKASCVCSGVTYTKAAITGGNFNNPDNRNVCGHYPSCYFPHVEWNCTDWRITGSDNHDITFTGARVRGTSQWKVCSAVDLTTGSLC